MLHQSCGCVSLGESRFVSRPVRHHDLRNLSRNFASSLISSCLKIRTPHEAPYYFSALFADLSGSVHLILLQSEFPIDECSQQQGLCWFGAVHPPTEGVIISGDDPATATTEADGDNRENSKSIEPRAYRAGMTGAISMMKRPSASLQPMSTL